MFVFYVHWSFIAMIRVLTFILNSLQKPANYIFQIHKSHWEVTKVNKTYIQRIQYSHSSVEENQKVKKWSTFRGFFTLFAPVGLCLFAVMQWRAYRRYTGEIGIANQWQIRFYCALPLRLVSRCWGWIADKKIPRLLRPYVYGLYASMFGVNVSEAISSDLKTYPTLADFFARELKEGAREIDTTSCLVSPCDGTVLHYGPAESGIIEQVKGVTYSLENFLGDNTWTKDCDKSNYYFSLLHHNDLIKKSRLYQCVIYLAPGDYHRFHSPTDWEPGYRRHFAGQLLSVNPSIANWLPGLFTLNERVVYVGHWPYGFFSFTAVGATNVGKIKVYMDVELQTNCTAIRKCNDKSLMTDSKLVRGTPLGEFRMGSTIVLIFEAPTSFEFTLSPGQKVKMGQSIGIINKYQYIGNAVCDENENKKNS